MAVFIFDHQARGVGRGAVVSGHELAAVLPTGAMKDDGERIARCPITAVDDFLDRSGDMLQLVPAGRPVHAGRMAGKCRGQGAISGRVGGRKGAAVGSIFGIDVIVHLNPLPGRRVYLHVGIGDGCTLRHIDTCEAHPGIVGTGATNRHGGCGQIDGAAGLVHVICRRAHLSGHRAGGRWLSRR